MELVVWAQRSGDGAGGKIKFFIVGLVFVLPLLLLLFMLFMLSRSRRLLSYIHDFYAFAGGVVGGGFI